ncbi:MAG: hypothetical protein GC152_09920 [Alphaproteobacteria bacterium]|nr:hypothetical protein [Alphaproteobacteria bacterium]
MSDEDAKRPRGRLKRAVADVAPQIAHALGGPLAGAAVGALSRAIFGEDGADEAALADALRTADADTLLRLKVADLAFRRALEDARLEDLRIAAGDRADARARQAKMDDLTPSVLGGLIIAGFFIVLAAMVTRRLPAGAETEFSIMLGALATMTAAVVNYFFGSSAGSREKTRLLSPGDGLSGQGAQPAKPRR